MIKRILQDKLVHSAKKYPIVTLTGPRQSGKTTLVKAAFPGKEYISLEDPDTLDFALNDPRGFLNQYPHGAIFDEIQRVPLLFSYLQTIVDKKQKNGLFILTGSQQFLLLEKITQSLSGRTSLFRLLPFSAEELQNSNIAVKKVDDSLYKGFYPRVHHHNINPRDWYPDYTATYIERDVRSIKNIGNLSLFHKFVKLCAARSGHLVNLSELGNVCGINHNTARSWLSVLEASYIIFLLQPHHVNFNKRLIKSPKLYFYDTGLLCSILNIRDPKSIIYSPQRGQIFETFIVSEIVKYFANRGEAGEIYFWRDKTGHEIDCVIEHNQDLIPVEIKAGETVVSDYFKNLDYWLDLSKISGQSYVIYGGDKKQARNRCTILPWNMVAKIFG